MCRIFLFIIITILNLKLFSLAINKFKDIDYQYFSQRVDHFDFSNTNTFNQRYLINDQYWNGSGPVFLMINGEIPLEIYVVFDYQYAIWGKEVGALIVALEHRYYGASLVTTNTSVENLTYLNIDQALADTANFISWLKSTIKIGSSSPPSPSPSIVTFGGSYAGMLTSFMRIKYSNLVDIAIASSAPLNTILNFSQYLEVVQLSILAGENGTLCLENIQIAHEKVINMLQQPNYGDTDEIFNLCTPISNENDQRYFIQSIVNNINQVVQNNNELPGIPSVDGICLIMVNQSQDPLTSYIQLWNEFNQYQNCVDISYSSFILNSQNETNDPYGPSNSRLWRWQQCTELGFFITTDAPSPTDQPFGNILDYDFLIQECSLIFNIPNMIPNVNWTIIEYGGLYPDPESADKILYVTSTLDPWCSLAITPPNSNYNTVSIVGGAHCSDMTPPNSVTPASLAPAQTLILQFILENLIDNK